MGTSITTSGLSYYLQRGSELFRCDEVGFGNEYVACWQFQPNIIEGRAIKNPSKLVGTWQSAAVEAPATWEFTDTNVTYVEDSRISHGTYPITISQSGDTYTVHLGGSGQIDFNMNPAGTQMTYKSPYYNDRLMVLVRQ